jgi:hypothetical protein
MNLIFLLKIILFQIKIEINLNQNILDLLLFKI